MPAAPDKLNALIKNCSLQTAQACFRELCPGGFKRRSEELENPDAKRFTGFTQFGELPLDGDTLFFAYAESEKDLTERSARKAQFDAARKLLKARGQYDAGIFIFRGPSKPFRLSFITKIYKGSKADFSHFRRYTYFVDHATDGNGTFIRQIGGCRFDSLNAIQEAFSVEAINKDFYKELANWYFWAMKHVHFPTDDVALDKKDLLADKQKVREHDAKNLIRLLTRMLFVWFIKQRGLVPHELFDAEAIARDYLDGFSADYLDGFDSTPGDSRYYKAILQNFFFAVLNQERDERAFTKGGADYMGNSAVMRYEDHFKDPEKFLDAVKDTTPFLNGGLFECLDFVIKVPKGDKKVSKKIYEDGFSDRKDNPLVVPDFLFFAPEHKADLSDTWGIASKKNEPVQGLIRIFNRYNFTIVENSPIEQEVALDPELLGKVFENLLASYNPETRTTARKQTGSFYTPRPIVDYMVDESLKAYLLKPLTERAGMTEDDAKAGLDLLFSYEEVDEDSLFESDQVDVLIHAIDRCKILDPACGSGAFPMGILQKLVFVLGKLDKKNRRWKERQLSKVDQVIQAAEGIEDSEFSGSIIADAQKQKGDIESAFESNDLGFGRKLYLIENCLYGVDIQSIATQVSKLRFFISLVVDQNIDRDHADGNFGVRPLPNLETKFVAADTLIAIDKPGAQGELAELTDIKKLQDELQAIRHKIFSVKTTTSKQKYKADDKAKREAIAAALKDSGWPNDTADRLAKWDPYKQHDSADFFDPEWMFGLTGFDVIIGNPPYVSYGLRGVGKIDKETKNKLCRLFPHSAEYKISIYAMFMEKAVKLCSPHGISSLIVPDSFLLGKYFSKIRSYVISECAIRQLLLIRDRVFDNVTIGQAVIYSFERTSECLAQKVSVALGSESYFRGIRTDVTYEQSYFQGMERSRFRLYFNLLTKKVIDAMESAEGVCALRDAIKFRSGLIAKAGQSTIKSTTSLNEHWKPGISSGGAVHRFFVDYKGEYLCCEPKQIKSGGIDTVNYFSPKLFVRQTGDSIICAYDSNGLLALNNVHIGEMVPSTSLNIKVVCAILNSSAVDYFYTVTSLEKGRAMAQVDIDMLDVIPIPIVEDKGLLAISTLFDLIYFGANKASDGDVGFYGELIDACVMECYFCEHMAERDLLFHDTVAEALQDYNPDATEAEQLNYLEIVHQRLIAARILERIARIPEASPDLLAVILNEGRV